LNTKMSEEDLEKLKKICKDKKLNYEDFLD